MKTKGGVFIVGQWLLTMARLGSAEVVVQKWKKSSSQEIVTQSITELTQKENEGFCKRPKTINNQVWSMQVIACCRLVVAYYIAVVALLIYYTFSALVSAQKKRAKRAILMQNLRVKKETKKR